MKADHADIETVRTALKRFAHIALDHQHGGLGADYEMAKQAIEAMDRIEHSTTSNGLLGVEKTTLQEV